jgi:hypothetical protein
MVKQTTAVVLVALGMVDFVGTQIAFFKGGHQILIGRDDDRQDNPAFQGAAAANQSLNRTDVLVGGRATM